MIDYKTLLEKYLRHVGMVEGSTVVHMLNDDLSGSDVKFSTEEVAELERIDQEDSKRVL